MSYEQRNLKVFLSSSMGEFRHERDAVKQELDSLGIRNYVFEHEGASDQAPAERFRDAVRGASVYIGVFGKQCGNYTREEFETARTQKIACHLYVQRMRDDERSEELKEFLQSLKGVTNVPTISEFQSTDRLVVQIKRDLWTWADELVGRQDLGRDQIDLKSNLPILCDRDDQEVNFEEEVVSYFQVRSTRPLLLILTGHVQEKHGLYLERVKLWSLDEYLTKAGIRGEKKVLRFRKSPCAMTAPVHLQREILGLLRGQETGDDGVILAHIRQARLKALLIEIRLLASECEGSPQKPLQLIADYLAAFPDTKESVLVSVVVSLEEDSKQGRLKRWLGMVGSNKPDGLFEKSILDLEGRYRDGSKLLVKALPRLAPPKVADVRRWLDHELVKPSALRVGEKEIEEIFQGRESLPMDDLYPKLTDLLEKRGK
jgi:hypothetical protein